MVSLGSSERTFKPLPRPLPDPLFQHIALVLHLLGQPVRIRLLDH